MLAVAEMGGGQRSGRAGEDETLDGVVWWCYGARGAIVSTAWAAWWWVGGNVHGCEWLILHASHAEWMERR